MQCHRHARAARLAVLLLLALTTTACFRSSSGGRRGGSPTFSKSFGTAVDDAAFRVVPTRDGGYVLAGGTAITDVDDPGYDEAGDMWVMKLDTFGDVEWERLVGQQLPAGDLRHFRAARRAADGSVWVAHDAWMSLDRTGDPMIDGGNVVLSHFDANGGLLGSWTFDSGIPSGRVPASALETTVEEVLDLWPTQDGDVFVVARTTLRIVEGMQVGDLEGLFFLEVSPTGTILSRSTLFNDEGGFEYGGEGARIARAFVREVIVDQPFLAISLSERSVLERARFLELATDGSVQNALDLDMRLLALDTWDDGLDGTIDGVVAAGSTNDDFAREAMLVNLQPNAVVVSSWSTPATIEYTSVCCKNWFDPGRVPRTEFWAAERTSIERWDGAGTFLGAASAGGLVLALEHETLPNVVRVVTETVDKTLDEDFATVRSTAITSTGAWFGPGGLLLEDPPALHTVDELGTEEAVLLRSSNASNLELGFDAVELASGEIVLSGSVFQDPLQPSDDEPGQRARFAWILGFDAFGGMMWQWGLAGEGTDASVSPYRVPLLARGGDVLTTAGGGALRQMNGSTLQPVRGTSDDVAALVACPDGGFAGIGGPNDCNYADTCEPIVTKWDADAEFLWSRRVGLTSAAFGAPARGLAIAEDTLVLASTIHSFDAAAVLLTTLDASGAFVRASTLRFGALSPLDSALLVAAADGGYLLAVTVVDIDNRAGAGAENWLLVRLDETCAPVWYRLYGGLSADWLSSLVALPDGYVLAGRSLSLGDGYEAWVLRVGLDGRIGNGCPALIAEGPIPAEWSATPETPFVQPVSSLPLSLPDESPYAFEPIARAGELVVARQCSGAAVVPAPEPDPDPDPTGDFVLTIERVGGGSGHVRTGLPGIDCPSACSASFPAGTTLFLSPTADPGFFFSHWEDVDEDFGIEGARVTMDADRTVRVWFE